MSFAGVLVGVGYVAYNHLSVDLLNKFGANINTDGLFDPEADIPVDTLTLKELIENIAYMSTIGDEVTIDYLVSKFGLKLDEYTNSFIPNGLKTLPLYKMFGENGLYEVLDCVDVGYVLGFIPDGVISDPLVNTIRNKTLADVVDMDLGYVFDGVELGFLLGVEYEKNVDGEYVMVQADPDVMSIQEILAPIDMGDVLKSVQNGSFDILQIIDDNLTDITISILASSLQFQEIPGVIGDKTLGDIIREDDESGNLVFDIAVITDGVKLGEIMGYYYDESDGIWYADDGTEGDERSPADPMFNPICGVLLDDLIEPPEGQNSADVILGSFRNEETRLGVVMGYYYDESDKTWYVDRAYAEGEEPEEADAFFGPICNVFLADLIDPLPGESASDSIMREYELSGTKLGDVMGYYYDENTKKWYEDKKYAPGEAPIEADAFFAPICNVGLGDILDPKPGENPADKLMDEFNKAGTKLGDVMGYVYDSTDGEWYLDNGKSGDERERVDGLFGPICNVSLSDLINPKPGENPSDKIMEQYEIAGTLLGEIMGYYLDDDGNWYVDDGKVGDQRSKADPLFSPLCGIPLIDLIDNPDGKAASDVVMDQFDQSGTLLGDIMGYTKVENPDYNSADPDSKEHIWFDEAGKQVTGVGAIISDKPLSEVMDGGINTDEITTDLTIAEVYNITKAEHFPVYIEGSLVDISDEVELNLWLTKSGGKASTVISALAGCTVGELDASIDSIKISDVMGLVEYNGVTYTYKLLGSVSDESDNRYVVLTPDDSVTVEFADLDLKALSNGELDSEIETVKIGKFLGYKLNSEGKWVDSNGVVTGILGIVADATTATLAETIENTTVADIAGYVKNPLDGKWYTDDSFTKEAPGILSALAELTIEEITDEDVLRAKVQTIKISDVLGYSYDEVKKVYYYYDSNGNRVDVDGVMAVIAGSTVGDVESSINKTTIGQIAGYVYVTDANGKGAWYVEYTDENNNIPATGILASLSDLRVDELTEEGAIRDKVQSIRISDVLGYTYDELNKVYRDSHGNEVTGVMAAIAGSTVGNVEDAVNTTSIAQVVGYVKGEDGKWYTSSGEEAHGVLVSFSDLTIGSINEDEMSVRIKSIRIAEVFGYYEGGTVINGELRGEAGKWYNDANCTSEVTGIMGAIAGEPISEINSAIRGREMGVLLGYVLDYKREGDVLTGNVIYTDDGQGNLVATKWWYTEKTDSSGNVIIDESTGKPVMIAVHPLINKVSCEKFSNVGSITDRLTIGDVIPAEDRESGYLSLISPDTKLDELPAELNNIFENTTIAQLVEAGVIKLAPGKTLNSRIAAMSINELLNSSLLD